MMNKGIDVSHWQGNIDWNKVKRPVSSLPSSKLAAPMPVFIRIANGKQITKVRKQPVFLLVLTILSERTV